MISMSSLKPEPSLFVVDLITTDEDKKFAPAGRMAAAIIKITHKNGSCSPQDLSAKGFTPDEVLAHWHMAQSLASVELKLMSKNRMPKLWWGKKNV